MIISEKSNDLLLENFSGGKGKINFSSEKSGCCRKSIKSSLFIALLSQCVVMSINISGVLSGDDEHRLITNTGAVNTCHQGIRGQII
jgi:hypothetical protein